MTEIMSHSTRTGGRTEPGLGGAGARAALPGRYGPGRTGRVARAGRTGRVESLPRKRPRPPALDVELVVLAVTDGRRWLLEKRGARGRMAGLWQMPTVEVPGPERRGLLFPTRAPRPFRVGRTLCEVRHTITRHRIRAKVKRATLESAGPGASFAWVSRERLEGMALTGMTRKCLSAILPARSRPSNPNRPRS